MEEQVDVEVDMTGKEIMPAYIMEAPVFSQTGAISISTNFDTFKADLKRIVEKYKAMQLTDDNVELITFVKKALRSTRQQTPKALAQYMAQYFDLPLSLIKSQVADAMHLIQDAEDHIDSLLEQADQERKDRLTAMYDAYWVEARAEYGLPETFVKPLDKSFYLKGANTNQAELRGKIFAFCKEEKDAQVKKASDIQSVTAMCSAYNLDAGPYVLMLQYRDVSLVLADVTKAAADKKALTEAIAKKAQEDAAKEIEQSSGIPGNPFEDLSLAVASESTPVLEHAAESISPVTGEREVEMTMTVRLTYKSFQTKLIREFFAKNGIDARIIK